MSYALELATNGEITIKNAVEVGIAMDESVSQTRKAVSEVTNLAQSLQEGAGPQIDLALNEAQMLLEDIKELHPNLTEKYDESKTALNKSSELYAKMAKIALPLEIPSQSLKSLKNQTRIFVDKIEDIKNYTDIARDKASQTAYINDANRCVIGGRGRGEKRNVFFNFCRRFFIRSRDSLSKQNERISAVAKLKDIANDALDVLVKTVNNASNDLEKSREEFAKLGTENESMKAIKSKVESTIERETLVLEELQRGLDKAKAYADKLKEQVHDYFTIITRYVHFVFIEIDKI